MTQQARLVQKGTFTKPTPIVTVPHPTAGQDGYDWRNPFHNPEGIRPRKPRKQCITEKQVQKHVAKLRKMAEDCDEIGPIDLIHELDITPEMREAVVDALLA